MQLKNNTVLITGGTSGIGLELVKQLTEKGANIIATGRKLDALDVLFTYAQRFYERQFITRKITNNKILTRVEEILTDFFSQTDLINKGLPTVQYIADQLNISPKYLGSLLKQLTGLSTQQHIHEKLIDKAKEKLSTTNLSVSEIAYELGFEHSQSFSKLFKNKTNVSPLEFRQSFN